MKLTYIFGMIKRMKSLECTETTIQSLTIGFPREFIYQNDDGWKLIKIYFTLFMQLKK